MSAEQEFAEAISPHTIARMDEAKKSQTRFVHYTSASSAMSIIQNECVWMRSAAAMNDFSEVEHGRRCLQAAWHHEVHGNKMQALMNSVESGLAQRLQQVYTDRFAELYNETFLISVSEHGSALSDEDKYGRLSIYVASIWREYQRSVRLQQCAFSP